jgi:hypothetical protein
VSLTFYWKIGNKLKLKYENTSFYWIELILVFRILDWHEFLRKKKKER